MNSNANRPLFIIVSLVGIVAIATVYFTLMNSADHSRIQNTVPGQDSVVTTTVQDVVSTGTPAVKRPSFEASFELVTGTFTFKVMCDGKLYDEKVPCAAAKTLVVVRDERPTGSTLVEEKTLATVTTTKDDMIVFRAFAVPGVGEGKDIIVNFYAQDTRNLGVCMTNRDMAIYDTESPGTYKALKNYPDYTDYGVWANGVLAFVPGCSSGAGYPSDSVMIYNPTKDRVVTVTETKAVPPGLWDDAKGFPFDMSSDKLPYWSDLKWNDDLLAFTINLHLVNDDHRIQPYAFEASGKDVTAEGL